MYLIHLTKFRLITIKPIIVNKGQNGIAQRNEINKWIKGSK